jgi:hypothetical protein
VLEASECVEVEEEQSPADVVRVPVGEVLGNWFERDDESDELENNP